MNRGVRWSVERTSNAGKAYEVSKRRRSGVAHSSSIMSELAKFVAATLQERVAVDLEEENKALRTKNEWLESERTKTFEYASRNGRVEITGKDGVPVYAHGEMKHSRVYADDDDGRYLLLDCDREESTQCPIDKLKEVEWNCIWSLPLSCERALYYVVTIELEAVE